MEYRTVGDREKRSLLKARLGNLEQQHFQLSVIRDLAAATDKEAEAEKFGVEIAEIETAIGVVAALLDALPDEDPDNPDPPATVSATRGVSRR